jgi:hypothetical protein
MSASEIARILPRIDEERQLPKQRQRRPGIPFDMHRAGETVEAHALRRTYRRLLTHRMKAGIRKIVRHAPDNARFSSNPNQPTAVFRIRRRRRSARVPPAMKARQSMVGSLNWLWTTHLVMTWLVQGRCPPSALTMTTTSGGVRQTVRSYPVSAAFAKRRTHGVVAHSDHL